ncbi:MAG: hypothetical protein MHMPM18_003755 [Marteilia pararefringens]
MSSMAPQNNSPASTNRLQFPTIGEINDAAATADSLNNQILLSEMEFDDFQFFSEEEGEEDQLGDKVTDNDDNNSRMEKRRSDGIVRNKFSGNFLSVIAIFEILIPIDLLIVICLLCNHHIALF